MDELTETQAKVLEFLVNFRDSNQVLPTRSEISNWFKWSSPNSAEDHLKALERKGKIELVSGRSRGIKIL